MSSDKETDLAADALYGVSLSLYSETGTWDLVKAYTTTLFDSRWDDVNDDDIVYQSHCVLFPFFWHYVWIIMFTLWFFLDNSKNEREKRYGNNGESGGDDDNYDDDDDDDDDNLNTIFLDLILPMYWIIRRLHVFRLAGVSLKCLFP